MQPVEKKQQRSPWFYIGIGCGFVLVMGVLLVGALILFTVNEVGEFKEEMANPITRTEKVKKALGAKRLPEGYYAVMALSVPLLVDTAILSTHPPDVPSGFRRGEERIFTYIGLKASTSSDLADVRDYLEGRSEDSTLLARNDIRVQTDEIISRGALPLEGRRVLFLTLRGRLRGKHGEKEGPSLNAITLIECPGQTQVRMGLWVAPDPSPEAPLDELELTGTPADESALKSFMSHFNPCQQER